ncbi:hypothetical protein ACFQY0_05835 [Haloferula chungangensis]|uniref:Cytochrome c domain-containing protein n=1 Tax=Haloferula chungangensis TaxID=1048331 RepID=A0ABW2L5W7_9BACT
MKPWWTILLAAQLAAGQVDVWDLPPIRYSDTPAGDPLATLAAKLENGEIALEGETPLEKLKFVLETLGVPESSQILVFSKTSKQIGKITPSNPRSLYFSDDTYVGYVPGGEIEVIAEDPVLGPIFYLIDLDHASGFEVMRDTNDCMSCHGTTRTENVPGLVVRSVFPDESGHSLLHLGTTAVTHSTPIELRWGGYYVTGNSAFPHLGNRTYVDEASTKPEHQSLVDLSDRIDPRKYLRKTSDVVALVVIEHQCRMHNLLTAASMRYRRAQFLGRVIDPEGNPDDGQAGRIADQMAERVVDELLFKDEADLGDGLEGDGAFQRDFEAAYPRTKSGDSLADFKLYRRIFKNPCSYMIYSKPFRALPARVKKAVLARLRLALSDEDREVAPHLKVSEKERIREILDETLPEWKS